MHFISTLSCLCLTTTALFSQEMLVLKPPLSQVFPLEAHQEGIRVAFPVMLSINTIVKPDAILRFVYIDPNIGAHFKAPGTERADGFPTGNGGGGGGGHHHHSTEDSSSTDAGQDSANSDNSSSGKPHDDITQNMSKEEKAEVLSEAWLRVDPFKEAFDQALDSGTNLVYLVPSSPKPVISPLDFPEGLFLGEKSGHVIVLAVLDKSTGSDAGVLPGDEIASINGKLPIHSLRDFSHTYSATKKLVDQPIRTLSRWK